MSGQVSSNENKGGQLTSRHFSTGQGNVMLVQIRSGQVRTTSGEIRSDVAWITHDNVGAYLVRSSQVRSGQ